MMRWPIVLLVIGLLVAGMSYDRVEHVATGPAPAGPVPVVNPVLTEPAPLSSVWYCPVGSAGGGYAEHTVEVANMGTEAAVATLAVLTDQGPGPSIRLDIGAGTRRSIALAELETSSVAGAVVEVVSGQGVVDHVVATPHGPVRGPCATGASDEWHFAGGVTTRDASFTLALLNPFPEDAVFDIRFEAGDRTRIPSELQGAIVPARSVRVIEVGASVAREGAVATTVALRRGRVVAERVQSFNGVLGPVGSALQLGSPAPSLQWWFPAGRLHISGDHRLVLYNPGETVAEVDVELQPLDPALTAAYGLVPLEVSIGPHRFEIVDLVATAAQLGVPLPLDVGLHVQSVNGIPVVGERWSLAPPLDTAAIGADATPPIDQAAPTAPDAPSEAPPPPTADPAPGAPAPSATDVPPALVVPDQPGTTAPGDGVEHEDVPAEEAAPPPVSTQATPTSGVVIDRGVVTSASRWVLPGTPMLTDHATVLVVVGVGSAATVEVGPATGADRGDGPVTTAEVAAGQPVLVPLTSDEPLQDLLVSATGRVVVAISVVDRDGALSVLGGVPVLEGSRS